VPLRVGMEPGIASSHWNREVDLGLRVRVSLLTHSRHRWRGAVRTIPTIRATVCPSENHCGFGLPLRLPWGRVRCIKSGLTALQYEGLSGTHILRLGRVSPGRALFSPS
jgi:hypothetical protein